MNKVNRHRPDAVWQDAEDAKCPESDITADGGLYRRGRGYVRWAIGDSKITLDGDFTIAELQQFVDHMSSARADRTNPSLYIDKLEKQIEHMERIIVHLRIEIRALRGPSSDWLTRYRYRLRGPNTSDAWEPGREQD